MSTSSSPTQTPSRTSSITLSEPSSPAPSKSAPAAVLLSAFKKPFQGWSRELMRARDDDDDDYNFVSGLRRGDR
jgi:hypothetical protein